MSEEMNLVDGLEMAIECIRDLSPCYEGDEWDDSEEAAAISGIRAAQHHVADLAQRLADLEAERDELSARLAELERQEPVAWIAPAEVSEDWPWPHAFIAPGTHPHIIELMHAFPVYGRPVPAIPPGWKLVKVKAAEFDSLMYWLDRCESKGHMDRCSDLIEPWYAFEYAEVAAPEHKA